MESEMTARVTNTVRAIIISCGLILSSHLLADTYDITSEEFSLLPPFCQFLNEDRQVALPRGMPHAQHLCHGLKYVVRANLSVGNPAKEQDNLQSAAGEFEYVLRHTKKENNAGYYNKYLAVVSVEKATVLMRLNDATGSLKLFQRAIKYNPKLSKAYAGLSDLYQKLGMTEDARTTLETGLQRVPGSKSLQRKLDRL